MLEEKKSQSLRKKSWRIKRKAFYHQSYKRILDQHQQAKMSVVQATDEVLRPRNKFISCLFTDIRNFTNSSNDLDQYLSGSAIPNIKLITSITDKNGGISSYW